jgi:hypothetical protein
MTAPRFSFEKEENVTMTSSTEVGFLWLSIAPPADKATPQMFFCWHKGLLYQWYAYITRVEGIPDTPGGYLGAWVPVPTI